jgi:septum site-determining protein MinD
MARIIGFVCSKGGSGKSTLVANVGVALARLGRKVVIVDCDLTMANLSLLLGVEDHKTTLHDVLAGEAPLSRAICRGPEGVRVVPGGIPLEGIQRAKLERLKRVIEQLSRQFDLVLVDVPSGLDRDALTVMGLLKEAIIVVTPDLPALSNALKTKLVCERLNVRVLGVIVTRLREGVSELSESEISGILDLPVLAAIPEDRAVRHSAAIGEPVVVREARSPSAREIKRFALELRPFPKARG